MKHKMRGFTLIEIMIAVAIVAILAAVAIPSYNSSIQKSRRSDAKAALVSAASAQERWSFQYNGYSNGGVNMVDIGGDTSPEGFYTISNSTNAGVGECIDDPRINCFILTATPVAGLSQVHDTMCTTFTLSHIGVKGATGSVPSQCW